MVTRADSPPADTSGHDHPAFGVEEEFILVDLATGHPVGRNREVAEATAHRGVDLDLELTSCQVEIATSTCATSAEALDQVRHLRSVVAEAAHEVGVGVIAAGVPPTVPDDFPITTTDRYRRIGEQFGMLAHEQGICGSHVHVAVPDRETAVAVSNHLRHRLPTLLALSANSVIYRDSDTGHASWRSVLWSRWPAAGPPPHLESAAHFERLVALLVSSGAILDDHMVYWDIRPSDHLPTVEIRVGDVQSRPDETIAMATLIRALVMTALDDIARGVDPPFVTTEVLDAAMWKSAHDGIDGDGIDVRALESAPAAQMVSRLVDDVAHALDDLGDRASIDDVLDRITRDGNGATRRRAMMAAGASGRDVVEVYRAEFGR